MKELITITEQNGQRAVSARELHQFLESKQEFANWIKNRISDYGFIEGQDFEVFDNFIKNPTGGRPAKEYALSLDMAKELSMVERNEKGREARRYFIEMEKLAKQNLIKELGSTIAVKKIKVRKDFIREKQQKLFEALDKNLKKADLEEISERFEIKYGRLYRIIKGKIEFKESTDLIHALYERALENKQNTTEIFKNELAAYEIMIEELQK